MLLHSSKNWESVPAYTPEADDEGCRLWHVRNANPHAPLLPGVSRTGRDTITSRLSATLMSLHPNLQVRPLCQRGITGLQGLVSFYTLKWNPVLVLAFPPIIGGKDWDKPMEDCYWPCTTDQFIWPQRQASLGGTMSLRLWRKGNCKA